MKSNNHIINKGGLSTRSQVVFTILLILGLFLLNTSHTDADIFAERTVRGNAFTATTLDFSQRHSANNSQLNLLFNTQGYLPDGFDLRGVIIKKEGKMDFRYRMKTVVKNGDPDFCNSFETNFAHSSMPSFFAETLGWRINNWRSDIRPLIFPSMYFM